MDRSKKKKREENFRPVDSLVDVQYLGADHLISGGGGGVEENVPEQSIYFCTFGNNFLFYHG